MKSYEDVIIKPHITEKSTIEAASGRYTFVVDTKAKKNEIRDAAEKLFQVKVLKVSTINYQGKPKRLGVHSGTRASWKKAIIMIDLNPEQAAYLGEHGKQMTTAKKYKTSIEQYGIAK